MQFQVLQLWAWNKQFNNQLWILHSCANTKQAKSAAISGGFMVGSTRRVIACCRLAVLEPRALLKKSKIHHFHTVTWLWHHPGAAQFPPVRKWGLLVLTSCFYSELFHHILFCSYYCFLTSVGKLVFWQISVPREDNRSQTVGAVQLSEHLPLLCPDSWWKSLLIGKPSSRHQTNLRPFHKNRIESQLILDFIGVLFLYCHTSHS